MPRRKELLRSRKRNDRTIERILETVAAGVPWLKNQVGFGRFDLIGLVDGYFFGLPLDVLDGDDEQGQRELWGVLKDEILAQHYQRRPGTRPAAWWKFDALELRRLVGRDVDEDEKGNGHDDGRLPAAQDPNLPDWARGKTYFGKPIVYDGFLYETEHEYLKRMDLLSTGEKEIFAKYGDIKFVRISSGIYAKCETCWQEAREIAKDIRFDLGAVALPYEIFWLPEALVFDCDHSDLYTGTSYDGIFNEESRP